RHLATSETPAKDLLCCSKGARSSGPQLSTEVPNCVGGLRSIASAPLVGIQVRNPRDPSLSGRSVSGPPLAYGRHSVEWHRGNQSDSRLFCRSDFVFGENH